MFNIRGYVMATSDEGVVADLISQPNNKILHCGDPVDPVSTDPRVIKAIPFVPDYSLLSMIIDGNVQGFNIAYDQALTRVESVEFFAIIIAALYSGNNVILYFPRESLELGYCNSWLTHFMNNYGITAQTKNTIFAVNPAFQQYHARLMYINNLLSVTDFIMVAEELDERCIQKLRIDLVPYIANNTATMNEADFCNEVDRIKIEITKFGQPSEMAFSIGG